MLRKKQHLIKNLMTFSKKLELYRKSGFFIFINKQFTDISATYSYEKITLRRLLNFIISILVRWCFFFSFSQISFKCRLFTRSLNIRKAFNKLLSIFVLIALPLKSQISLRYSKPLKVPL